MRLIWPLFLIACGTSEEDSADSYAPAECRESSAFDGSLLREATEQPWPSPRSSRDCDSHRRHQRRQLPRHRGVSDWNARPQRLLLVHATETTAQSAGTGWTDISESSGLFTNAREPGHAAAIHIFGDVDNDGDLDSFSGYTDRGRDDDPGDRSLIHLNDGTGLFTPAESSAIAIEEGYATSGAHS